MVFDEETLPKTQLNICVLWIYSKCPSYCFVEKYYIFFSIFIKPTGHSETSIKKLTLTKKKK